MGTGAEIHKQVLEHAILARRYRKKEKKNVLKFDIFYKNKTIPQVTDLATKGRQIFDYVIHCGFPKIQHSITQQTFVVLLS